MKFKECPECGAHLDHNEVCDCRTKKEDASDAAETPSKSADGYTDTVSNPWADVNRCLKLREIRQETGVMAKDVALVVREVFPKFNRQLLAQCEAPDKYGILIHPDGLRAICEAYGVELEPAEEVQGMEVKVEGAAKPRKPEKRKLARRLTFRMSPKDFDKMQRRVEKDGFLSVQAWLYHAITKLLEGDEV